MSSDDDFDPTAARIPLQKIPLQAFHPNRSPTKARMNLPKGRGNRPLERPVGGLKPLTASAMVLKQGMRNKQARNKKREALTKPFHRVRSPSPIRK